MTERASIVSRTERELADRTAQELAAEGYEVTVEPGPLMLPPSLRRFRPDILAQRGDEKLIVEVKLVPDPAGAEKVRSLAEAVKGQPGWHFRLAIADRELASSPWTVEEAAARVDEADSLLRGGHAEAALLLLTAAAEAVGRRLGEIEGLKLQRWNHRTVSGELVHHGLMSQEDGFLLDRAQRLRNMVMHGGTGGDGAELAATAPALVDALRRLLAEVEESKRLMAAEAARETAPAA